ncbi:2-oxo acid dehydrogenase subunit E2 [Tundrisphaera lichenicola]|uniref:2-oxo acid dehydrogenase subunit E2 n=1 Tax=Tundrisphaera lichenicola TaxID=2029860 RepID=UPI003EBE7EFC
MIDGSRHHGFKVEPRNKFFEANRSIVEHEIRPGNTVSFLAEVDLTEVEEIRGLAPSGLKPSYTALVAKAVALALGDFPYANRRVCRRAWAPFASRLQSFTRRDVAVAVEREIPGAESVAFIDILRDADELSLAEMTESLRALATCDATNNAQWREFSGLITRLPNWLSAWLIRLPFFAPSLWVKYRGGAVLISSPSKYGVDVVVGTWSHPVGVSFGLVKPRAVVRENAIVIRPTFHLSMNFDRRVMAGAQAARFFKRVVENLERAGSVMAPFLEVSESGEKSEIRTHARTSRATA